MHHHELVDDVDALVRVDPCRELAQVEGVLLLVCNLALAVHKPADGGVLQLALELLKEALLALHPKSLLPLHLVARADVLGVESNIVLILAEHPRSLACRRVLATGEAEIE